MAESVIGLYKTECVRHDGPFRSVDDLELATLSWCTGSTPPGSSSVALPALLRRFPTLALAATESELTFCGGGPVNGVRALPVRW